MKKEQTDEEKKIEEIPTPPLEEKKEDDFKDKYLRLLAEMENARKRIQKEMQETVRYSIDNTISEFLPVLDNFENALKFASSSSEEVKNWAFGFQMILTQFKDILVAHGIVGFHSEGTLYDPKYHEAMEIVETNDVPDGTILAEFSKGYKTSHRVLRPARVKVAKNVEEQSSSSSDEEKDETIEEENSNN